MQDTGSFVRPFRGGGGAQLAASKQVSFFCFRYALVSRLVASDLSQGAGVCSHCDTFVQQTFESVHRGNREREREGEEKGEKEGEKKKGKTKHRAKES